MDTILSPDQSAGTAPDAPVRPDRVVLSHKMFSTTGAVSFRASESNDAIVMVLDMGEREAAIPLQSLRATLGITETSHDGVMLTSIENGLDFVDCLRPGDRLPPEVLTGEASWQVDPVHAQIAQARLQLLLLGWLDGTSRVPRRADSAAMLATIDDPETRSQLQVAYARAAKALDVPGEPAILRLIGELARELAYIEALRDRLLRRVHNVTKLVQRLVQEWKGDSDHAETLAQVERLTLDAVRDIAACLADIDAQTTSVMEMLRNPEAPRAMIRATRDRLYRTLRGWRPLLDDWEELAPGRSTEQTRRLLQRTYKFLAPRFAPKTEWKPLASQTLTREIATDPMVW